MLAVLLGLLGAAAVPVGIAFSRWVAGISLLDTWASIPFAAVLGLVAIVLGRRSRRWVEFSLGRAAGLRAARVGTWLGVLALCLALTAGVALGFYGLLVLLGE